MIRSLPSTVASPVGVVKKGDILEGQPRDGWLLLLGADSPTSGQLQSYVQAQFSVKSP